MSPSNLKWGVLSLLLVAGTALGEEERLKPFVLASTSKGEIQAVAEALKPRLTAAGFEIVGDYTPYATARILVVTSPELKAAAARSKFGAYGAIQRVTVTRVGDSFMNIKCAPDEIEAVLRDVVWGDVSRQ